MAPVSTEPDDPARDAASAAEIAAAGHPSDSPIYRATPQEALRRFVAKYAVFHGRASRSEFWWACVLNIVVLLAAGVAAEMADALAGPSTSPPSAADTVIRAVLVLYAVAALLPSISVLVRRLHDANLSGWWSLLTLIPFAGPVIAVIFGILPRQGYGRRFDRS